jgi:retron-type reverse transcriptase
VETIGNLFGLGFVQKFLKKGKKSGGSDGQDIVTFSSVEARAYRSLLLRLNSDFSLSLMTFESLLNFFYGKERKMETPVRPDFGEDVKTSDYRIYRLEHNGKVREIAEPKPELKKKQRQILHWLCARGIGASKYAHGFVRGKSTVTAAKLHTGKNVILKMDIKDFFPSISKQRVLHTLMKEGIEKEIAENIAETCTLNNYLPQGAPTSPFLSNLVAKSLDYRLAGLCRSWAPTFKIYYTRYADDLIFSSNLRKLNHMIPAIMRIVEQEGFKVNHAKTRVLRNSNRQKVLGLVVNDKVNVKRDYWRNLRAEMHQLKLKARNEGKLPSDSLFSNRLAEVTGKAAYIFGVNRERGRQFMREVKEIKKLVAQ